MSVLSAENEFKSIFEAINDISRFVNLASSESLNLEVVKRILFASHYVETLIAGLRKRGLERIFEVKLNEYLKSRDKIFFVNIHQLEKCCDEVLTKILTIQPPVEVLSLAIQEYIKLLSYDRFEDLVNRLTEFRSLFVKLSFATKDVLKVSEVESSFLVQSWLKVLDSAENGEKDVETVISQMFEDGANVETIIAILNMETRHISVVHNIFFKIIRSEVSKSPFSSSWKGILLSESVINLVHKHPILLDSVLSSFEAMENSYQLDEENKLWYTSRSSDIDFVSFVKVFKAFFYYEEFHFKIKRFLRIRKIKGNPEFWNCLEKELI